MRITMRVHTLTLDRDTDVPMATLYRRDNVKIARKQGWTDRITIPAGKLRLGDLVEITVAPLDVSE